MEGKGEVFHFNLEEEAREFSKKRGKGFEGGRWDLCRGQRLGPERSLSFSSKKGTREVENVRM
jgi:hypothetical protein